MKSCVVFRHLLRLALLALASAAANAQTGATLGGKAEFLRAVAGSPALSAAASRTDAARERIGAAGRLADLEVEGMGSRMVGPMNERTTMWELNVKQPLPRRGERAADRERALAGVSLAEADYAVMAGEMAADTATAVAEADGAEARIRLLQTQVDRLDAVLRTVETRIAAGSGRLADKLTVESRRAGMQLAIEEERLMAADALAEARGRLGLKPDAILPAFAAPTPADIAADQAAALRLAAARTDEAQALVKLARTSGNPMTSVGVRFAQERRVMGQENTMGIAVSTDLPFRSRRYARAEVRAAEAERAAAQSDATAVRYRIHAVLTRVDRAERLAATARRLSQETIGRLSAEYDSLLRMAGVGGGASSTILETVELLEKVTEAELQVIRADTAVRTARAELWRYLSAAEFILTSNP